ncbi:hypothetical protein BDV33DRAFT_169022 [Aspergillus novoparasiticus]|uniref:Uncharacterized protein n=1 Tax=Aspergillus novoparasiticus TaxID=986946 RepID=A0A5N6EX48_9EURO|nr:hypothetical protein BDV33DRAFT_169022 [Aspergillus novoparasiticus]
MKYQAPETFFSISIRNYFFLFGPLPLSCSPVLCFFVTRLSFPCLWEFFFFFFSSPFSLLFSLS